NLSFYKGKPQLQPLAASFVSIISGSNITQDMLVDLKTAVKLGKDGGVQMIGPLRAANVNEFRSKAGKKHLRLVVIDNTETVGGIIFESNWDANTKRLFDSGKPFYVNATVGNFQ